MGIRNYLKDMILKIVNFDIGDIAWWGVIVALVLMVTIFSVLVYILNKENRKPNKGNSGKEKNTFLYAIILIFQFVVSYVVFHMFLKKDYGIDWKVSSLTDDIVYSFGIDWFVVVVCIFFSALLNFGNLIDWLIKKIDQSKNKDENWCKALVHVLKIDRFNIVFFFLFFALFIEIVWWQFPNRYFEVKEALMHLNIKLGEWGTFGLAGFIALIPWIKKMDFLDATVRGIRWIWSKFLILVSWLFFETFNFQHDEPTITRRFIECFTLPFKFCISITFVSIALEYFPAFPVVYDGWIRIINHVIIQFTFYWFLWRIVDKERGILVPVFENYSGLKDYAKSYVGIVSPLLKILIFIFGGSFILQEFGVDMTVAFQTLSIGSALAAGAITWVSHSSLSNMVCGMILIMDKPFSKGDWVIIGDVEGEVEEISFRCTKIRKFSQELVEIPNSVVTEQPITNVQSIEEKKIRRVEISFYIDYFVEPRILRKAFSQIKGFLTRYRKEKMKELEEKNKPGEQKELEEKNKPGEQKGLEGKDKPGEEGKDQSKKNSQNVKLIKCYHKCIDCFEPKCKKIIKSFKEKFAKYKKIVFKAPGINKNNMTINKSVAQNQNLSIPDETKEYENRSVIQDNIRTNEINDNPLERPPFVIFSEFEDFAARIDVVVYVPVPDYFKFLECKNNINLKIVEILAKNGIKIAVPILKRKEVRYEEIRD